MTTIYKSVHIEGCWPYKYEPTQRLDKNAKERERYWRKKAASVKTINGKKLLKLPVYDMDVFQRLNYESAKSRK
jgi:hypothetical protein